MSIVTRPRTSKSAVPERRLILPSFAPRGPDRRRQVARRRAAVIAVVAALLITALVVFVLSGSGVVPPATGAARVVPADALAYVHLSTDPARPAVRDAEALARRFPDYPLAYTAVVNRLSVLVGGSASGADSFANAARPWLGKEAALAVLARGGSTSLLIVLDVKSASRARAFVSRAGASPVGAYHGIPILGYSSGTELAFVRHYLVVGSDAGVRGAIDVAAGRARSLANDAAYKRASAGEPAARVLDAYLPAAGLRGLLETRAGVAGAVGLLLDRAGLVGTTLSVSAVAGGADVFIHSAVAKHSHPVTFAPTLQSVLPTGSTLMLDVDGLGRAAPQLLRAAATAGFAGNVAPLLARLGAALTAEGVNVHKIDAIFAGETAVALSPGPSPSLLIVARTSNEAATRSELAGLEGPLTALFPAPASGPGQVSGLADQEVGGVTVHELGLGPGLQIDYAVSDGLVVVSTSVRAIDEVVSRGRSLADEKAYQTVLSDRPARLSSVLFTDFSRLLSLGEQIGLTGGTRVRELLPDLTKVRDIGLSSTSGESDTTTELRLEIP